MYIQVATGQVASTGMVLLSYVQKVSEKVSQSWRSRFMLFFNWTFFISFIKCTFQVSLASELMCNYLSRDVTASFGYDYILRQVAFLFSHEFSHNVSTVVKLAGMWGLD